MSTSKAFHDKVKRVLMGMEQELSRQHSYYIRKDIINVATVRIVTAHEQVIKGESIWDESR